MNFDHVKKCKIVLVSNDKGQRAVYVDGQLLIKGKKININDILRALKVTHSTVYYSSKQMAHMNGKFPDKVSNLYKKDKEGLEDETNDTTKH